MMQHVQLLHTTSPLQCRPPHSLLHSAGSVFVCRSHYPSHCLSPSHCPSHSFSIVILCTNYRHNCIVTLQQNLQFSVLQGNASSTGSRLQPCTSTSCPSQSASQPPCSSSSSTVLLSSPSSSTSLPASTQPMHLRLRLLRHAMPTAHPCTMARDRWSIGSDLG